MIRWINPIKEATAGYFTLQLVMSNRHSAHVWFVGRRWLWFSHTVLLHCENRITHQLLFFCLWVCFTVKMIWPMTLTCPVSSDNGWRTGVELHCNTGSHVEHMSGLLADGVGAGCRHHRHGYRWRGTFSLVLFHVHVLFCLYPLSHPCLCWPLRVLLFLQESGREKSFRYWPRLGSRHNTVTYGRFKITTRFRTESGCYATTGLKIKHLLTGQERTVWHLQYTDWPDHDCPEDFKGFLSEWGLVSALYICVTFEFMATLTSLICATCFHSFSSEDLEWIFSSFPSLPRGDPVCEKAHKQHQWPKEHQLTCTGPLQRWGGKVWSGHPIWDHDSLSRAQWGNTGYMSTCVCVYKWNTSVYLTLGVFVSATGCPRYPKEAACTEDDDGSDFLPVQLHLQGPRRVPPQLQADLRTGVSPAQSIYTVIADDFRGGNVLQVYARLHCDDVAS